MEALNLRYYVTRCMVTPDSGSLMKVKYLQDEWLIKIDRFEE